MKALLAVFLLGGSLGVVADTPSPSKTAYEFWASFSALEQHAIVYSFMHGVYDASNDKQVKECAQLAGSTYLDAVVKDVTVNLKEGKAQSIFEILEDEIGACIDPKGGDPKSSTPGTSI